MLLKYKSVPVCYSQTASEIHRQYQHTWLKNCEPLPSWQLASPWPSEEEPGFQTSEQLVQSVFTTPCSIETNMSLEYIYGTYVIFSHLSSPTKWRAFIFVHTVNPVPVLSTSGSPALSTTLRWASPGFACNLSLPAWVLNLFSLHLFKVNLWSKG